MKTVMVFGVFDGLDEGHQYFLEKASRLGDQLFVVVAPDSAVGRLKKKCPFDDENKRLGYLKQVSYITKVILGDETPGTWQAVTEHKPDIVALGHDQSGLERALRSFTTKKNLSVTFTTIDKKA